MNIINSRVRRAAKYNAGIPDDGYTEVVRLGTLAFAAEDSTAEMPVEELEVEFISVMAGEEKHLYVVFAHLGPIDEALPAITRGPVVRGGDMTFSKPVLDLYQRAASSILEYTASTIMDEAVDGIPFSRTIYTGTGIGGAIAVLVATQSPPHSLITFGVPPFCNRAVERKIRNAVAEREQKVASRGAAPVPFEWLSIEDVDDCCTASLRTAPFHRLGTGVLLTEKGPLVNPSALRRWIVRNAKPFWFTPDASYFFYALEYQRD